MILLNIKDFQNIKEIELIIEGFCVVVGESNIGKSSIVRALRCVVENPPATSFIRNGESEARVSVTIPDKLVRVTWIRKKSAAEYLLEKLDEKLNPVSEEKFSKIGSGKKSVPDPILNLRFGRVVNQEIDTTLAIVDQHRYFYLIDDPNQLVGLMGELRAVAALNGALSRAKKEHREVSSNIKMTKAQLKDSKEALAHYEPLDKVQEECLSPLTKLEESIEKAKGLVSTLEAVGQSIENERKRKKSSAAIVSVITGVPDPEEIRQGVENLGNTKSELKALKELQGSLDKSREAAAIKVPKVGVIGLDEVLENLDSYNKAKATLARLKEIQDALQQFMAINQAPVIKIVEVPSLEKLEKAYNFLKEITTLARRIDDAQDDLMHLGPTPDEEIGKLEAEITVILKQHPHCEVCGQPLTREHLEATHDNRT